MAKVLPRSGCGVATFLVYKELTIKDSNTKGKGDNNEEIE